MFRPKLSIVYILAMILGLTAALADDTPKLRVVGGNPNAERVTDRPSYVMPSNNPWNIGWNNHDVSENNLVSRAVVAAYSDRAEVLDYLNVTREQAEAAKPLLRVDPRGLVLLTDREFLRVKEVLGFNLQSLNQFVEAKNTQKSFVVYVSYLDYIFRLSPDEQSTAEWAQLAAHLREDLAELWNDLSDSPRDLFSPDGETYISTRSLMAAILLKMPLDEKTKEELMFDWFEHILLDFNQQKIYADSGYNEYADFREPRENGLDVAPEHTIGRWMKEIIALKHLPRSRARTKLFTQMLTKNLTGTRIHEDIFIWHPYRQYLITALASVLAEDINSQSIGWQTFISVYERKKSNFLNREINFAMVWAEKNSLIESPHVGQDVRSFLYKIFKSHWVRLHRDIMLYKSYDQLVPSFRAYINIADEREAFIEIQDTLGRIFVSRLDDYREVEMLSNVNMARSTMARATNELYSLMLSMNFSDQDRAYAIGSVMKAFLVGGMNMSPEFNQKIIEDYRKYVGHDSRAHEEFMASFLSRGLMDFPSESQLEMFEELTNLSGAEQSRFVKEKYYVEVIKSFIFKTIQYSVEEAPRDVVAKYDKTIEILGQLREVSGADYKNYLLYILDLVDAHKKNAAVPRLLDVRQIDRPLNLRSPNYPEESESFQDVLARDVLKQLQLFRGDLDVQALCNELFEQKL